MAACGNYYWFFFPFFDSPIHTPALSHYISPADLDTCYANQVALQPAAMPLPPNAGFRGICHHICLFNKANAGYSWCLTPVSPAFGRLSQRIINSKQWDAIWKKREFQTEKRYYSRQEMQQWVFNNNCSSDKTSLATILTNTKPRKCRYKRL